MGTDGDATCAALRGDIRDTRERIIDALTRIDYLTLQYIPQVRRDYALKVGCWEQALAEAELSGRRARRRLQLAQTQANRGEVPRLDEIEERLDEELASWMEAVARGREDYERALAERIGSVTLAESDAAELKALHRTLVRRLHPDVCRAERERASSLFKLAQEAYASGDVAALRSLEVATRDLEQTGDDLADVEDAAALELELECARIEEKVVTERLAEVEGCEEMALAQRLRDPAWLAERTAELRQAIEEWERVVRECDARVEGLMG